jgi:tRNA nucleotidyltransferase (CCA-adding enzyme)
MTQNLAQTIEEKLPSNLYRMVGKAAALAAQRQQPLYLVGGLVRDTLLGLPNFDIDLVVEGDAIGIAKELASSMDGKLTIHERFGTAKIRVADWTIDLATARSETYSSPGALPAVCPGKLRDDLIRRDFTINALAIKLTPPHAGELIDLYGGQPDMQNKVIRVLHEKSFTDDATRIWRAIRYQQRLGFTIEENTLRLIKRDCGYLDTISGDRVRHELELVLKESAPEKMLRRAASLKVLAKIHPSLKGDAWLQAKFKAARKSVEVHHLLAFYYALLAYRLSAKELEEFIAFLHPAKHIAIVLRDAVKIKEHLAALEESPLKPSRIYAILHGYTPTAVSANALTATSAAAQKNLRLYLEHLRYVKPSLTGDDLLEMGCKPGPQIQIILNNLLKAKLDGIVLTRANEEVLVREWLQAK